MIISPMYKSMISYYISLNYFQICMITPKSRKGPTSQMNYFWQELAHVPNVLIFQFYWLVQRYLISRIKRMPRNSPGPCPDVPEWVCVLVKGILSALVLAKMKQRAEVVKPLFVDAAHPPTEVARRERHVVHRVQHPRRAARGQLSASPVLSYC
jgi:hypothetical protein